MGDSKPTGDSVKALMGHCEGEWVGTHRRG